MPVSPARAAACKILLRVEAENAYAAELLNSSQYESLSSQDHGLATELVMGVLRWRSLLDEQVAKSSNLPLKKLDIEVLTALRMAAYQLLFLDRVPFSAAVNESVEIVKRSRKRSAMPFANAVLRKLAVLLPAVKNELRSSGGNSPSLAVSAHPDWLVQRWRNRYGGEVTKTICEYDQRVPQTSIHLSDNAAEGELQDEGIELEPGKLAMRARRVVSGDVTATASFRKGSVSIQDEASQLVALLAGKAATVLDCCAAPGGKTRILAERNPLASILAVDLHPHRAHLLRKLAPDRNVQVVAGNALQLPTNALFECVLVDVPCSGTGTFARNPEIKWKLRLEDIADLQSRQKGILRSAMNRVAPGGRLVYSTCSLEQEENEDVVENALQADASFRVMNCLDILRTLRSQNELALREETLASIVSGNYLRTIPGAYPADGFFAAVLERS